jgi:hypothetical protein
MAKNSTKKKNKKKKPTLTWKPVGGDSTAAYALFL